MQYVIDMSIIKAKSSASHSSKLQISLTLHYCLFTLGYCLFNPG